MLNMLGSHDVYCLSRSFYGDPIAILSFEVATSTVKSHKRGSRIVQTLVLYDLAIDVDKSKSSQFLPEALTLPSEDFNAGLNSTEIVSRLITF